MTKEQLFRLIVKENNKRDEYIESIPSDIRDGVFDNTYTNSILSVCDALMDKVFGEHADAVYWFLYDWKPGAIVSSRGFEAKINTIDEYIEFMKKYEGFKDE